MLQDRSETLKTDRPLGTLLLIALLMVGSVLIRAGFVTGPAFAKEGQMSAADPARPNRSGADDTLIQPHDLQVLLDTLRAREATVTTREEELSTRAKALKEAEAQLAEQLALLKQTEEALRQTLALADGAAEQDLTRLTNVFEQMKPKETAALFEEMDPLFAAGFLSRMRPDAAAGILAGMSPKSAYTLSVVLAGRNTAVPTE